MLEIATRIVKDYGNVLGKAKPGMYGLPESLLPYTRTQIKNAIQYLLQNIGEEDVEIRQSLIQGYVYLAQFVPDSDVAVIAAGQNAALSADANAQGVATDAMRLINKIKLAMEKALNEVTTIVQG